LVVIKITISMLCVLSLAAAFAPLARADLYSAFVSSLDWLTDSSDVIVIVEVARTGNRKVVRTATVLKGTDHVRLKGWPPAELVRLVAELPEGRRLLIFGRLDRHKTPRIRDLIALSEDAKLPPGVSVEAARYIAVTGGLDAKAKQGVCAALTKEHDLLTKPEQVLRLVRKRIAQGSRVPADCDRERVEHSYSGDDYGGSYRATGTPFDTNEVIHHVLVPWEPEYEKGLREELRRAHGPARVVVARQLANYRSRETIAALKACLDDEFVATKKENGALVSFYALRAAAYQSLRRLNVDVSRPQLRPDAD
jgi:hypothetical protein